eukprot:6464583-Amphidinium_carterae.1
MELIRFSSHCSFSDPERPLVSMLQHTWLSVRCRNLEVAWEVLRVRQRNALKMALSSRMLMCARRSEGDQG